MERIKLIVLGEKIIIFRVGLNLSQEKLAEICNFDRTYVSLLERGKRNPSYLNLLKLSIGLQTTVSELTKDLK